MNVAERQALFTEARESGQLDQLSAEQRAAFTLWAAHGLGYKRIGIMLGIGRDSARGRVDRALSRLKRAALAL